MHIRRVTRAHGWCSLDTYQDTYKDTYKGAWPLLIGCCSLVQDLRQRCAQGDKDGRWGCVLYSFTASKRDQHTRKRDLHTSKRDLHASKEEIRTEDGDAWLDGDACFTHSLEEDDGGRELFICLQLHRVLLAHCLLCLHGLGCKVEGLGFRF